MNDICAVIGVAANVIQWTPPRVGQTDRQTDTDWRTDGQTEKFNTISLRFTGDNYSKNKNTKQLQMILINGTRYLEHVHQVTTFIKSTNNNETNIATTVNT